MSFIIGDEIVTEEIPVELEPILKKLKTNSRDKSMMLMNTIANSDRFMAYVIPQAGMVLFFNELTDDRKIFRYLISSNGDLFIDNKQRRGQMHCPLFDALEQEIINLTGKEPETVPDDNEYKIYDKFMPKIVETINQILVHKPEIFKQ